MISKGMNVEMQRGTKVRKLGSLSLLLVFVLSWRF